jgi:hypothetical protein
MAQDVAQVSGAREHSALAVMLLLPELSTLYLDDIISSADKIPDPDVLWLLDELSRRNGTHLQAVTDLAISRKLVAGPRANFLDVVRRKVNLPPTVVVALIQAAAHDISRNEVAAFGTWYDQDAEKVLFTCLVTATEADIQLAALDALGAKAITDPFLGSFIEFVRLTYRENRGVLARLVGVLGLGEQIPEAEFQAAFDGLENLPKTRELILNLLKSPSPRVISEVTSRYATYLDVTSLLELLQHPDKTVRMAAVKNLKNANDIAALKLLLDAYDKEADPEVKAVYEENIAVVRERRAKRGE